MASLFRAIKITDRKQNQPPRAGGLGPSHLKLLCLRHAFQCKLSDTHPCPLASCKSTKKLLVHITACKCRSTCGFKQGCADAKALLGHYHCCKNRACTLCKPVRMVVASQVREKRRRLSSTGCHKRRRTESGCKILSDLPTSPALISPTPATPAQRPMGTSANCSAIALLACASLVVKPLQTSDRANLKINSKKRPISESPRSPRRRAQAALELERLKQAQQQQQKGQEPRSRARSLTPSRWILRKPSARIANRSQSMSQSPEPPALYTGNSSV